MRSSREALSRLVLLRQEYRENSSGLVRIGRVWRTPLHRCVVVVKFPENLPLEKGKASEVVFAVRVVVLRELFELTHSLQDFSVLFESYDPLGNYNLTARKTRSCCVIQPCNLAGLWTDTFVHTQCVRR